MAAPVNAKPPGAGEGRAMTKSHILKLAEGEVVLSWPHPLSQKSHQEIADWFADALVAARASVAQAAVAETDDDDSDYRY